MNSRAVTSSDIGWIVKIMCKSSALVNGRESLCLALGLTDAQLTDIDRDRDKKAGTHGYLTMALNLWISIFSDTTIERLVEVLRAENLNKTADTILKNQTELPPNYAVNLDQDSPSVWFDVPEDIHMFTGRVEDLKELHESILAQNLKNGKNDMTVITAVCGTGGVGKSSLTIHYAWAFFNVFYVNVIWINSETKNTIADSFNRLGRKLGQITSSELFEIVSAVYEYFGKTKTLIIFDNVECYEDIKSFIPVRSPKAIRPYVLISSRNRNWHVRTHLIDLNVFRTEESVEFFKSYLSLRTDEDLEQAKIISEALQNLPLAIRQAGAYIKVQHRDNKESIVHGLKAYLNLLETNSAELLKFEHWSHTADIYEKTIYTTWTVNMRHLKRQKYITNKIMNLISYCNSDNIPIKLLLNIPDTRFWKGRVLGKRVADSDVYSAIKLLSDFSLITRHVESNSISIHRLLQKVVRDQVQRKKKTTEFDSVISLIKIPLQLSNYDNYEDICLIHSLSIRDHIPENRFREKKMQLFLTLIYSKQDNSIDSNINRLKILLEEGRYAELLELYEKVRKLYSTRSVSKKDRMDDVFTLTILNIVLYDIIRDCLSHRNSDRVNRNCQFIKDVLLGFTISSNDNANDDSMKVRQLVERIYQTVFNYEISWPNSVLETRKKILSMVYSKLRRNYYRHDPISSVLHVFCIMLSCLIELSAFMEIHGFLESIEILMSESFLSSQSDSEMLILRDLIHKLFVKLKDSNLLRIESELVQRVSLIQNRIYTFYNNKNDFESAIECGSVLVECQIELNKPFEALTTLIDIHELILSLAESPHYIYNDLIWTDIIYMVSSHPNGNVIRNQTIEIALKLYKVNSISRAYSTYDQRRHKYDIWVFNCLVELNQTSEISQFIQSFELWLQNTLNMVEQFDDLTYIFEFTSDILLYAGRADCKDNISDIIFMRTIPILKLFYKLNKHKLYTSYCTKMSLNLVLYLGSQKKYAEIIALVKDYDSYLEEVMPRLGTVDISDVILADIIMKSGEESGIEKYKNVFCILAYSIYNRVYMFNWPLNEGLIKEHICAGKIILTNVMNCLASLRKLDQLLNFVKACNTCLEAEPTFSNARVLLGDSIRQVSEHSNCSGVREELRILSYIN